MDRNLSTFSFKKFPKALILTAIAIISLEAAAWLVLPSIERNCAGGDLIRMDHDFLCRNFRKYATDAPRKERYKDIYYTSYREMSKDGPYDVIVFGNSAGGSGWAEVLRADYGMKICNTTSEVKFRGILPEVFINTVGNYNKINNSRPSVLLFVGITGRAPDRLRVSDNIRGRVAALQNGRGVKDWKFATPAMKVMEYAAKKIWFFLRPQVKIIDIGGRKELFFVSDMEGLSLDFQYTPKEYALLERQFKEFKEIAAENKCVFAITAFPTKPQQYEWLLFTQGQVKKSNGRPNLKALEELALENNIPFLDLESELGPIVKEVYAKTGKLLWSRCDTHLNQLGNKYAAEIIKEFLYKITVAGDKE